MVNRLQLIVYSLQTTSIPVENFFRSNNPITVHPFILGTFDRQPKVSSNILNIKLKKTQNFNYNFKFDNGSAFHLEQRRPNENDILTDLDDLI